MSNRKMRTTKTTRKIGTIEVGHPSEPVYDYFMQEAMPLVRKRPTTPQEASETMSKLLRVMVSYDTTLKALARTT